MFSLTPASSVIDLCHGKLLFVLFYSQGGLRNSKHEFTLSSQEYVHELRSGITEEKLFHCLESLRVSLTSNPVRLVVPASFTLHNCDPRWGSTTPSQNQTKVTIWLLRGLFRLFSTPFVKVCCKETAAWENYKYTHRCKINKWYFPLICITLQKKETCQTGTQLQWRITLLCLIVHNAVEMIKAQTKR